jgi:hypothetical protein
MYIDERVHPGQIVEHAIMNPSEAFMFSPEGHDNLPSSYSVLKLETRLEKFIISETIKPQDLQWRSFQETYEMIRHELETIMRTRIAQYGLLIEDSLTFEEDRDYFSRERCILVLLRANALMPTYSGDSINGLPKRYPCQHCGTSAFEDQYHSGTCENCGAPFDRMHYA